MATTLKNVSRKPEEAKKVQAELSRDKPVAKTADVKSEDVKSEDVKSEDVKSEDGGSNDAVVEKPQPTTSTANLNQTQRNPAKSDAAAKPEPNPEPNPDFEPEFDGDLAHVSWLPRKVFGNKKGF